MTHRTTIHLMTRGILVLATAAALLLPAVTIAQQYDSTGSNPAELDPTTIDKYVDPLVVPPAMPRTGKINVKGGKNIDYYEIAERQFGQQILPSTYAGPGCAAGIDGPCPTTVWSYGSLAFPGTIAQGGSFNYPAFTLETKWEKPIRVRWVNDLVASPDTCGTAAEQPGDCNFLPHVLPVDQTLHWANPPGVCKDGRNATDCRGTSQDPYLGPVPMIVHVHGAETYEWSDGYPEAWYLPAADDIPGGYFTRGAFYDTFKGSAETFYDPNDKKAPTPITWGPGFATFEYPNTQEATTLWYHDHALGMTRLNVYAGPAGFYLLRGGPGDMVVGTLPGPAPALGDPPGIDYYEIPIVVQDRSFYVDGSLAYPDNRAFFEELDPDQLQIPFTPDAAINGAASDVAPIWLPEFFGNTLVTNGKTWPNLDVEPRRYRLRMLNGSQSRFLILQFENPSVDVWQIGAEQGFLPAPLNINPLVTNGVSGGVLLGPAERADLIVDFSALPVGTTVRLLNFGPDEPFGGGVVGADFDPAHPATTGQVMQFTVVALKSTDLSTPPAQLMLPAPPVLGPATNTRQITLNELESEAVCVIEDDLGNLVEVDCLSPGAAPFGPTEARLGTLDAAGNGEPLGWAQATTENSALNSTEIWEIYNFTADAHPIHIHLVQFQVVDRQLLTTDAEGMAVQPAQLIAGTVRVPEAWESGYKDTVIAYPGEVTRVKALFPLEGLFVWHCHILEHEDNEMMRPYCVGNSAACQQHNAMAAGL
jgi:FtsP/CotA-like multicopper oxidase with cupredoxin domain